MKFTCYGVYPQWPEDGTWCDVVEAEDRDSAEAVALAVMGRNCLNDAEFDPSPEAAARAAEYAEDCTIQDVWEGDVFTLAASTLKMLAALKRLIAVVDDARADEMVDGMTQAGGYICGDVMSRAFEQAQDAIAKAEGKTE